MLAIHRRCICIGDSHVKNLLKTSTDIKWLDFEGSYHNKKSQSQQS